MEINKPIHDLQLNDEIKGFYILKGSYPKVAGNGKPFLSVTLSDKTGAIEGKVWDYSGPINGSDEGKVAKLQGTVTEFRGTLQVTIDKIRLAEPEHDQYDVSALVPVAPIDQEAAYDKVKNLISSIEDDDYRSICEELLWRHEESFKKIPAAKSVHHGFLMGLLMHTGNMMQLAGTFAHDLQKEEEFALSELGLVTDYTMKGQLLGHLVMGAQEVADLANQLSIPQEKSVLLQHMVLSHHGEPEFGAAVRPMCAESELLSYIDMIDSRMEIYRENYEQMAPGEFSSRIFALDRRIYKHN